MLKRELSFKDSSELTLDMVRNVTINNLLFATAIKHIEPKELFMICTKVQNDEELTEEECYYYECMEQLGSIPEKGLLIDDVLFLLSIGKEFYLLNEVKDVETIVDDSIGNCKFISELSSQKTISFSEFDGNIYLDQDFCEELEKYRDYILQNCIQCDDYSHSLN